MTDPAKARKPSRFVASAIVTATTNGIRLPSARRARHAKAALRSKPAAVSRKSA
ncbi:hypothetical protein Q4543_00890 [Salipiger sp. 1_MG-2023]|uniref:hypothetical protein n=1 Tax=Salipiger sp. 1_MG-2023 TaxID=3062665 RepID=UPI0026E1C9B2|nr:hypothetical protein [Salipiger sp. 1_MG-2023]MDO6584061.1 hypothetical protein [Salipiger sp. 1_MG-2023]